MRWCVAVTLTGHRSLQMPTAAADAGLCKGRGRASTNKQEHSTNRSTRCRHTRRNAVCWTPIWNPDHEGVGLEHLLLSERAADSVLLADRRAARAVSPRLPADVGRCVAPAPSRARGRHRSQQPDAGAEHRRPRPLATRRRPRDRRTRRLHRHRHLAHAVHQQLSDPARADGGGRAARVPHGLGVRARSHRAAAGAGLHAAGRAAVSVRESRRQRLSGRAAGG